MFDIYDSSREEQHYTNKHTILNIDDDIGSDIDDIFTNRFDELYERHQYKLNHNAIDIVSPKLHYHGSLSRPLSPDRVRYLLSFYPNRHDLQKISKIILRPRFIEIGRIELIALYIRQKKILVIYLYHPHFYTVPNSHFYNGGPGNNNTIQKIAQNKLLDDTISNQNETLINIHPLWYILSIINDNDDKMIDKFFIKKQDMNDKLYEILNDISFYYSSHGY